MKYSVQCYTIVRVEIPDVEADSIAEACQKVEDKVDFYEIFDNDLKSWTGARYTEWDENMECFLVTDPENKDHWRWKDGKTPFINIPFYIELLIQRLLNGMLLNNERINRIMRALLKEFKDEIPTLLGLNNTLDKYIHKILGE